MTLCFVDGFFVNFEAESQDRQSQFYRQVHAQRGRGNYEMGCPIKEVSRATRRQPAFALRALLWPPENWTV